MLCHCGRTNNIVSDTIKCVDFSLLLNKKQPFSTFRKNQKVQYLILRAVILFIYDVIRIVYYVGVQMYVYSNGQ